MSLALRKSLGEGETELIKSVELSNWKAFDSVRIDFLDGANFLIGPNAAGKTSVLEAISLAFTGETLTVDDPKRLVKEGKNVPAKITVEFLYKLKSYEIERSLSKKKRIQSRIYSDRQLLAEGWDNVSEYLKELLGIDRRFFERILYMSEGDVFRFIAYPPKEGIMAQIEDALGIDRMESFLSEVEAQIEFYQSEEEEYKVRKSLLRELLPKERIELPSLIARKKETEKILYALEVKSKNITKKVFISEMQMKRLENMTSEIDEIEDALKDLVKVSRFRRDSLQEIGRVQDGIRSKLERITGEIQPKLKRKGALEERIRHQNKVLDLLSSVGTKKKRMVNCPVCGKPLSVTEAKDLENMFEDQKRETSKTLLALGLKLDELEMVHKSVEEALKRLENGESRLISICEELKTESLAKRGIKLRMKKLQQELKLLTSQRSQLETKRQQMRDALLKLKQTIQLETRIKEAGRIEQIEASLISTSKALIALEMLKKATEGTIRKERQRKLGPVYKEIANVWNKMRAAEGYRIELDDRTMPVLFKQEQKFDMPQLSGGEKMAILVIVRTVLCRRFTETGFMLLDEPLEHLDPRNRGILIDFLVESFEKGWVDQLIVTTFEESIIRKFHDHEKVNIIAI